MGRVAGAVGGAVVTVGVGRRIHRSVLLSRVLAVLGLGTLGRPL
jgi:hypothetical protein